MYWFDYLYLLLSASTLVVERDNSYMAKPPYRTELRFCSRRNDHQQESTGNFNYGIFGDRLLNSSGTRHQCKWRISMVHKWTQISVFSMRQQSLGGYEQQCARRNGIVVGFSSSTDSNDSSKPKPRNSIWCSIPNTNIRYGKTEQSNTAWTRWRRS